jgi:hypothetical protein
MATMDLTLPVESSTVFHRPTGEAAGEASAGFDLGAACVDAESENAMGAATRRKIRETKRRVEGSGMISH